ncbi:MAG: hypothetical protein HGA30_02425 [Anaerolineales bacterium]|nr:hypothetical protein [Anaerolineales bacterium]
MAKVIHPYHPLRDLLFPVLKNRTVSGVPTLILRGTRGGTFAIPRDWTDWNEPLLGAEATVIDGRLLPALLELTFQLKAMAKDRGCQHESQNRS